MRRTLLATALTLTLITQLVAAPKRPKDPVVDIKSLEAHVDAAKADLDQARAAALSEWQAVPEYRTAKSDLDTKKTALDKARETGTDKDKAQASDAYNKSKLSFDKVTQSLENNNETIVAKRKALEAAVKELNDHKRKLADNAKHIDGQRGVLAALPRDYWAQAGRGWTPLQQGAANKWLAENIVGKKIHVAGNASEISPGEKGRGATIRIEKPETPIGDRKITGTIDAHFPQVATPALRKLHDDSPVAIEGTIGELDIRWNAEGVVEINITIKSASLVSRP
jgi:Skp family chaperone for outer membrane proteins